MPIYEYERPDGSTFEIYQGFEDAALTSDPETGVSVKRVFHAPAVHFKGKGFYNTDYGTRKRQREMATQESSSSSGSDADKSDSKSAKSDGAQASDAAAKPAKAKPAKGEAGAAASKKRQPVSAK